MNRRWRIAFLGGLAGLAACSGGSSPTAAFRSWLTQVEQCNLEGMKASLSRESLQQVDALSAGLRNMVPKERQASFHLLTELCRSYQKGSMEVLEEQVDGDKATLRLKSRDKPVEARMVREDGAWKLDFASLMRQALSGSFPLRPPEKTPSAVPSAATPPSSPPGGESPRPEAPTP